MTPIRRRFAIILVVTTVLVAIGTVGWLWGPSGEVRGVEFSPDHFCHRSFRYSTWCGIQLTPTQTREWRSKVDEYVHANGFATNAGVDNPRWDFVKGFAPGVRGWRGRPILMCQSLGCYSGSDEWIIWSKAHPELAKVVWPQVVTWARNQQYDEISCLFDFTELENASSPTEIQEKIELAKKLARS